MLCLSVFELYSRWVPLKSYYFEIIGFFPRIMTSAFVDVVINSVEEFIKNQEKGSTKNATE